MPKRVGNTLYRSCLRSWPWVLVGALAITPVMLWSSQRAMSGMFNDPERWVSPQTRVRSDYEWFLDLFGTTDIIVVSWEGCTLEDERLDRFEAEMEALGESHDPDSNFAETYTGRSMLTELMGAPTNLSRRQALRRIRGAAVGADGESTCAVVVLTEKGIWDPDTALRVLLDKAEETTGLPRDEIVLGGPPIEGYSVDRASSGALNQLLGLSIFVSTTIAMLFIRSWRFVATVILVGLWGQILALAIVYWSGYPMNAVFVVMPPLIFVLLTSTGVHLINYYWDATGRVRSRVGSLAMVLHGWRPCAIAVATTAIGLVSLGLGVTVPVRVFGLTSAATLLIGSGLLLVALVRVAQSRPTPRSTVRVPGRAEHPVWDTWSHVVTSYWPTIVTGGVLGLLLAAWGVSSLTTSVRLPEMFRQDSKIMRDYRWLEDRIGPLVPVEVVLSFHESCELDHVGQLTLVREVHAGLSSVDGLGAATSAVTLLPSLPRRWNVRSVLRRTRYNELLSTETSRLEETGFMAEGDREWHWRVSTRAWALHPLDYGDLLREVERTTDDVIAATLPSSVDGVRVTVTGVVPFAYTVQRMLLRDLIVSFATAFALIGVVLAVAMGSLSRGLLAMAPNIFPTVMVFGILGAAGVALDIGSMMTASVALGIAVDDTVHFTTWFRRAVVAGMSRTEAVRFAFAHSGNAMLQTSLICGIGLLVYGLSDFVPAARFAWMMVYLLGATLIGDLALLPALLASPLGRVFCPRPSTESAPRVDQQPPEESAPRAVEPLVADAPAGEETVRTGAP